MKILIVEDSPPQAELIRFLLAERFQIEAKFREASNLTTAFRYLEAGDVDCMILDLQLPDSAGRETFDKIIARFPDIPIVIMTNTNDRNLALSMIQAGAADFISKDFTNEEDVFRRVLFAIEKHSRSVRVPKDKATSVHQLERARANMLTAHNSGEHVAIQTSTVETTSAVADLSRRMFTELQMLSGQLAQKNARDEHIQRVVDTLETELLKGTAGRVSMRSQVDVLEHRLGTVERRFSDFRELTETKIDDVEDKTEKRIGEVRSDIKSSEESQRLSAVHIQHASMSNRTKIVLGVFTLLGILATAYGSYKAAEYGGKIPHPEENSE